jgi:diamine N-acetyltransferase
VAVVQLHDILTHAQRAAVMKLRRGPGQERYLGSMASHLEDAVADVRACPRMWSVHDGDLLVGFVMISDGIPEERLAADDDLVGPYYLWRLLIDEQFQGRGYGKATIDAVVAYLRTRPGADLLWTSCRAGPGSPQPFYLRYGFVLTGDVRWGEDLLRLKIEPLGA